MKRMCMLKKWGGVLAVAVFAVSALFCVVGCGESESNTIIYQATNLAYNTGDSYTETFVLDPDKGTYERYIDGTYRGTKYTDRRYGLLFESGSYTESSSGIQFSSKMGYSSSSGKLVNLGAYDRSTYYGTLTDTSMTITWSYSHRETYKLK